MRGEPPFELLLGRTPSSRERERLLRAQKLLGLRDDDPTWLLVGVLQEHDASMGEHVEKMKAVLQGARADVQRAARTLAAAVTELQPAQEEERGAPGAAAWPWACAGAALLTLFGALCVSLGYTLGSRGAPAWVRGEGGGLERALAAVLGAPAGWMVLAFLVPLGLYGARVGWAMAVEPEAEPQQRARGAGLAALSLLSGLGCALVLARML